MSKLYDMIRPDLSADVNWDYANYMAEHFPCRISDDDLAKFNVTLNDFID